MGVYTPLIHQYSNLNLRFMSSFSLKDSKNGRLKSDRSKTSLVKTKFI